MILVDTEAQRRLNEGLVKDGKLSVNFEDEAFVRSQLTPTLVPEEVLLHALSYEKGGEDDAASPMRTSAM